MIDAGLTTIHFGLAQVEQALHHHNQWYDAIIRSLVCGLPSAPEDLDPEAHLHCGFGQWYYKEAPHAVRMHPSFVAIEVAHSRMHQLAARLLDRSSETGTVSTDDFDAFTDALASLRLEVSALKRELEEALYNIDVLAGANNRLGMLSSLREQHGLAKRLAQSCSIAMMDIDNFKKVNDRYGHLAGDHVLQAAAEYLMRQIRPYDKLFRYGGEEFLLCLPNTDLVTGHALVERLRRGLADLPISIGAHDPIRITMSFGVTTIDPNHTVEESIAAADQAMYQAKRDGRNCTRVHPDRRSL